uniref:Uncharacterized protein n=1 Tax=Brassica oleracea TaxID=3712 RepID=A0A3P6F033_BRAOL|nr:unnamed protein product [Brassica oleracea]
MESSEKRREEMDLAQRRRRRWRLALRITATNQLRTEDLIETLGCINRDVKGSVYYGHMTEILVRRASFPDEFTRLTSIMWINEIVLKHAYYKDQTCMSQATDSAMTTLVIVQPLFWLELEDRRNDLMSVSTTLTV